MKWPANCGSESLADTDSELRVIDRPSADGQPSVSRLLSNTIGDADSPLKGAARTARLLEEQFIWDGWPIGRIYGSEVELAGKYGVGRAVVRETARILEARATARMRRGRSGGLQLLAPAEACVQDMIGSFSHLNCMSPEDVGATREVMHRVAASAAGNNILIAFFSRTVDHLMQVSFPSHATLPVGAHETPAMTGPHIRAPGIAQRSRAARIVQELIKAAGPEQWANGYLLGNESELCERHRVDRGVLRQAIRVLEAAEMAVSLPGRGRGLMARSPGPASIIRLICCHFAAARVGYHESFQAFQALSVAAMTIAAQRAADPEIQAMQGRLTALQKRLDAALLHELAETEEQAFALSRDPLLDLFLRSAKASWVMRGHLPLSSRALREFFDCTVAVIDAIASRDPQAAAAAQTRKCLLLEHNLQQAFEALDTRARKFPSARLPFADSA